MKMCVCVCKSVVAGTTRPLKSGRLSRHNAIFGRCHTLSSSIQIWNMRCRNVWFRFAPVSIKSWRCVETTLNSHFWFPPGAQIQVLKSKKFRSLEQPQRPPLSLCCSPRPSTHQTSLASPPPPAPADAAAAATAAAPASPPPTPPDPVPPPPTPPQKCYSTSNSSHQWSSPLPPWTKTGERMDWKRGNIQSGKGQPYIHSKREKVCGFRFSVSKHCE